MTTYTHYVTVVPRVQTRYEQLVEASSVVYCLLSWSLWTKAITKTLVATYIKK
jgi:hypothetical protein